MDCLSSVSMLTYSNYEVILIDNGSTDGSVDYAKEVLPKIKVIEVNKNIGFPAAVNMGIKQSSSVYTVTLGNDTKVDRHWLEELVKIADLDEDVGSCQSKILTLADPRIIDSVGLGITKNGNVFQIGYHIKDEGQYDEVKEVLGACSAAVLYRRQALIQIGGFDDDFFAYYEDVDVALRLRSADWKCLYIPTAIVYHVGSGTGKEKSPLKTYLLGRNLYYYKIKNLPMEILFKFLIIQPAVIVSETLIHIKNKEFQLVIPYLRGNLDAFKNIGNIYRKRREIKSTNSSKFPSRILLSF